MKKPIYYSDDFHCIDSERKTLGSKFKTIYSVDVKYRVLNPDRKKNKWKTFTTDYGNYMLAATRFDVETGNRDCPSRMRLSKVSLRSTTYIKEKMVGKDVLRSVSFDSPLLRGFKEGVGAEW